MTEHNQYNLATVKGTEFPFADVCIILVEIFAVLVKVIRHRGYDTGRTAATTPCSNVGHLSGCSPCSRPCGPVAVGSCRPVGPHHTSAKFAVQPSLWAGCGRSLSAVFCCCCHTQCRCGGGCAAAQPPYPFPLILLETTYGNTKYRPI